MRAYGYLRKDKLECGYGCCTFKGGKALRCRAVVDKTRRKRARRLNKEVRREEEVVEGYSEL